MKTIDDGSGIEPFYGKFTKDMMNKMRKIAHHEHCDSLVAKFRKLASADIERYKNSGFQF